MDGYIELVCKPSVEDGILWVVEVYYVKVTYYVLAFSWPPKETGKDIFPNALILFPLKPISGEYEGYS